MPLRLLWLTTRAPALLKMCIRSHPPFSFFSTGRCFYPPPLIVVLNHMCLLLGPLSHLTKADARCKKEEYEKVCGRLFHLNNCWLWQKCPISYSILRGMLLNHGYHYIYYMRGWDHLSIPHICQFWGATTLLRPAKGPQKVRKFVTKKNC